MEMVNSAAYSELARIKDYSKEDIEILVSKILEHVDEGNEPALPTLVMAKKIALFGSLLDKGLKDLVSSDLDNYPKEHALFGSLCEKAEVGTKYDYTGCQAWVNLDDEVKAAEKKKKDLEKTLKALKAPMADLDTGEELVPPIKTSTSYVKVTVK